MDMASLISSLHLPAEGFWLRELYRGGVDVYIALLLSQTLNLCHLRLDSDFQHETSFVGAILKKAAAMSQKPRLEVLEHIVARLQLFLLISGIPTPNARAPTLLIRRPAPDA